MIATERAKCLANNNPLASSENLPYNYLGLEIRPAVAYYAKERVNKHACKGVLEFVGCNANVDLHRIIHRYHDASGADRLLLELVAIQFPDPHFKTAHAKRRVVTPKLVRVLAQNMPPGARVFLQSDVQSVLDDMRQRFRENPYFTDTVDSDNEYIPENPLGVPTEREGSVLKNNLPVYRSIFIRSEKSFETDSVV